MSTRKIIVKAKGAGLSEFERFVEQALHDLQNNTDEEFSRSLQTLYLCSAKEVPVGQGRKAVVLFVPVPLLSRFHTIQKRLVRELEKKLSGKHVLVIAQRRVLKPEKRGHRAYRQPRPRSRTFTAFCDAFLEDLVFPTEILGKRTRYRLDGSRVTKVIFDSKDEKNIEHKLDTFSSVYKKLTGLSVIFEFSVSV